MARHAFDLIAFDGDDTLWQQRAQLSRGA